MSEWLWAAPVAAAGAVGVLARRRALPVAPLVVCALVFATIGVLPWTVGPAATRYVWGQPLTPDLVRSLAVALAAGPWAAALYAGLRPWLPPAAQRRLFAGLLVGAGLVAAWFGADLWRPLGRGTYALALSLVLPVLVWVAPFMLLWWRVPPSGADLVTSDDADEPDDGDEADEADDEDDGGALRASRLRPRRLTPPPA